MNITQGSIVIIAFPFADQKTQKVRPALVISSTEFNKKSQDVWITGISTKGENEDYRIALGQKDLISGKLRKNSFIKCNSIAHIEKSLLKIAIGKANSEKIAEVVTIMQKILTTEKP